ncbi:hypothetical protein [Methylobacterium sp. J-070]|uniref:hypothetical protein n=1 Tax=Methylobacterium sp. J-070 TaxID=2836650 RepID=UPI001FBAA069|nr:hypothetical protein [Methylobacterium sp. J-070]MCJ2054744.1 hypothetical protein [Methylobacterium sp. J-070]
MPNGAQNGRPSAAGPGFADALSDQTQGYIEKRKADAARLVSDVGDAIRDTGAGFDALPQLKEFFDQAALGVDELAENISRRSFSEMYGEVHAAIRRRPGLATAAAVLTSLALFRLVNASKLQPVPRSHAVVPVDVLPTSDV